MHRGSLSGDSLSKVQLAALYQISVVLHTSLDYEQATKQILAILHDKAMLEYGMLALLDSNGQQLEIGVLHCDDSHTQRKQSRVQYKMGEGIVGRVLSTGQSIVIPMVSEELHFADKLDLYDWSKPFIAVPLKDSSANVMGVLAAQPAEGDLDALPMFNRFMEMTANLIARSVVLARAVNEEHNTLTENRDRLQRKVRINFGFDNMVCHADAVTKVMQQIRLV